MAVEPPSALLGAMQQLVGHRERRLLGSSALGDAGAERDRSEAALDRVGGPQVPLVLGREVVERGQVLPVAVERGEARFRLSASESPRSARGGSGPIAADATAASSSKPTPRRSLPGRDRAAAPMGKQGSPSTPTRRSLGTSHSRLGGRSRHACSLRRMRASGGRGTGRLDLVRRESRRGAAGDARMRPRAGAASRQEIPDRATLGCEFRLVAPVGRVRRTG
jgi:hypothetical protein